MTSAPVFDRFLHTEVDGVPVLSVDGPLPLHAELHFRVGRADEPFVDLGITHLVEHLVMGSLGRQPIDVNACVGASMTSFEATGSPSAVARFLTAVCRALSDLPTDRLEIERRVLVAEGGGCGPAGDAAALRYGCRGVGQLAIRDIGTARVDAARVREWAAERFTRGNAALSLTGFVPEGLALPLPDGPRWPLQRVSPRPLQLPAWESGFGGAVVSGRVEGDEDDVLALGRLLGRAAEDVVRHERGLAYDVDVDLLAVAPLTSEVALWADVQEDEAVRALRHLRAVVRRMACDGPTTAELVHDVETAEEALSDPRLAGDAVASAAQDLLTGLPTRTPAEKLAATRERTAEVLRRLAQQVVDSQLLLLPGEREWDEDGLVRVQPSTRPVPAGETFRRRLRSAAPRGCTLVVGADGVANVFADGTAFVAGWDDVVGVTVGEDGCHLVQAADGPSVHVDPEAFRGGERAVRLVLERVPAALVVPDPDRLVDATR